MRHLWDRIALARDGSGTYSLPEAPFVAGTTIASTAVNSDLSDIAAALTQSISKDGQTAYTGNQPMGGNKLTGLGAGTAASDAARVDQVQAGLVGYAAASGTDTYTASMSPAVAAYTTGAAYRVKFTNANATTTPTLNLNSLGAKTITRRDGSAVAAGDIAAGGVYDLFYDGTNFQIGSPSSVSAPVGASYVTLGTNATLTSERVLTAESVVTELTDAGAGSTITVGIAALGVAAAKIANATITIGKLVANIFSTATVVTPATNDHLVIADASDSGNTKLALVSALQTLIAPAKYASTAQSATINATLTLPHGLAGTPQFVSVYIQCTSADLNYSVGDQVLMNGTGIASANNRNYTVVKDATNIVVIKGTDTTLVLDKTARTVAAIDTTKWSVYVDAIYFP